jgi:DNA mismatch repair protein MSH5
MSVLDFHDQTEGPLKYRGLQLAKLQAQPAVIYVSTRADDEIISELKVSISADPEAGDMSVRLEASSLFSYKTALRYLQSLHVRGMPKGLETADKMSFLNSMINMTSPQQVCATGALLAVLHREGLLGSACPGRLDAEGAEEAALPGKSRIITVEALTEAALCDFLTVDAVALKSLQIFAEECHPSKMGVGVSKEGLSVSVSLQVSIQSAFCWSCPFQLAANLPTQV